MTPLDCVGAFALMPHWMNARANFLAKRHPRPKTPILPHGFGSGVWTHLDQQLVDECKFKADLRRKRWVQRKSQTATSTVA